MRGQTLVETVVILGTVALMSAIMIPTVGLIAARLWVTHALYERLRCELRQNSEVEISQCDQTLKSELKPIWWGHLVRSHFTVETDRSGRSAKAHALWCNSNERTLCPATKQLYFKLNIEESTIKDSRLWG